MQTINFEGGIAKLDLATLDRTAKYEMAKGGLRKNAPIEHSNLISNIIRNIEDNTSLRTEIEPIYVSEKHALRVMWDKEKQDCPIENYLIQRLITKIIIKNGSDAAGSIGIAYNEMGIQIAFGLHVFTCSNMVIHGDNLMGTYGPNKSDFSTVWSAFDDWMKKYKEKYDTYFEVVKKMKNAEVNEKDMFAFLGKLIYQAERANTTGANGNSLNISQTLRLIDRFEASEKENLSAWDVVMFGTENLKPEKDARDLTQIFGTTKAYCDFALQELCQN